MFSKNILKLDTEKEIKKISDTIHQQVFFDMKRRGVVIGLSGGIDSSVCAALCVKALGNNNIIALLMPERDSSTKSIEYGKLVANHLNIKYEIEDITPLLEASKCYQRQLEAIRNIFPTYNYNWKSKITIPPILEGNRLTIFRLTVQSPDGEIYTARMDPKTYAQIVAATNWKQRIRKAVEYYYADLLNYAVCGTPNRLEYDQGFFVKNGDGSADFKPIAHLYKTQVYMLAKALGLPEEIIQQIPSTDTYSLSQTQEEFFFAIPYEILDLCLYAYNNNVDPSHVAKEINLTTEEVKRIYKNIESKRRATRYLHLKPLLIEEFFQI